jgi:hypothetical protein
MKTTQSKLKRALKKYKNGKINIDKLNKIFIKLEVFDLVALSVKVTNTKKYTAYIKKTSMDNWSIKTIFDENIQSFHNAPIEKVISTVDEFVSKIEDKRVVKVGLQKQSAYTL